MAKAEFLMLAHVCDKDSRMYSYYDYFWSEKLDGMRAFWDGGLTRGEIVPWQPGVRSTGLWSRYMNSVIAPPEWLNKLPVGVTLDGELYMRRKMHQETMSIVGRTKNVLGYLWRHIKYPTFDTPGLADVFQPREIDNPNCQSTIDWGTIKWLQDLAAKKGIPWEHSLPFYRAYEKLQSLTTIDGVGTAHEQHRFSADKDLCVQDLRDMATEIASNKGEGIMIRSANSIWTPERSWNLLKIKPLQDAEARVIGYTFGRETDRGSKLLGTLGTLIVEWSGKTFKLGPFVDTDRRLVARDCLQAMQYNGGPVTDFRALAYKYACEHPEATAPDWIYAETFPLGTLVTFRYRELTTAGAPVEARYWRKKLD